MQNSLSEQIRSLRIGAGITQKDMAAKSGINQTAISLIESGKRSPRMDTIERIISAIRELNPSIGTITLAFPESKARAKKLQKYI